MHIQVEVSIAFVKVWMGCLAMQLNEGFRSVVFCPLRVFLKFIWAIMFFLEILSLCSESKCPTKTNLDYFGVLYNVESIGIVRFMHFRVTDVFLSMTDVIDALSSIATRFLTMECFF